MGGDERVGANGYGRMDGSEQDGQWRGGGG